MTVTTQILPINWVEKGHRSPQKNHSIMYLFLDVRLDLLLRCTLTSSTIRPFPNSCTQDIPFTSPIYTETGCGSPGFASYEMRPAGRKNNATNPPPRTSG